MRAYVEDEALTDALLLLERAVVPLELEARDLDHDLAHCTTARAA